MLSLTIDNPTVENIFINKFQSDKKSFFEFVINSYEENVFLSNFDKACKEVNLIKSGELQTGSLGDLISELKTHSN